MRRDAGKMIGTAICVDEDWFVQMRPGCPGSWPSLLDTLRKGYGIPSFVVKTSVVTAEDSVELGRALASESMVSAPVRVNGAETFSVKVYGGPYEPLLILPLTDERCVQEIRGVIFQGFWESDSLRSRF